MRRPKHSKELMLSACFKSDKVEGKDKRIGKKWIPKVEKLTILRRKYVKLISVMSNAGNPIACLSVFVRPRLEVILYPLTQIVDLVKIDSFIGT